MEKFRKIAVVSLLVMCSIGLILSLGFVNSEQAELECKSLEVDVNQDGDLYFLNKMDVEKLIKSRDSVIGQRKSSLNIPELEAALNSHEDIANAEVSITIDGRVKVKVKQRRPVVRIFNEFGDSYYMDDDGQLMPLSDKYTAKVLVANGKIRESYGKYYKRTMQEIVADSAARKNTVLDEIYALAKFIDTSAFWKSQIQQLYINSDKELELVPMVGDHKIIFGDTADMSGKFKKLQIFYTQGLNTTGWWNRYSVINLKFKNQIVCTKKEI